MEKFVIGNWKMNGDALQVHEYIHALRNVPGGIAARVGIAVPALYLAQLSALLRHEPLAVVAQDVSRFPGSGAYTGEISAAMLKEAGCDYVLIGHSERRRHFAEHDDILLGKLRCACEAGIVPILCVGESLAQRQDGSHAQVLAEQVGVLGAVKSMLPGGTAWVAYEPVWAIGSGQVAEPAQIVEAHAVIARALAPVCPAKILYGGSVKAGNAQAILSLSGVDGVLVGAASMAAAEMTTIIAAAQAA
jgi:triosephosphate isomerase